ncbi:MAG: proton-conducting transporter membrane subunit [Bacteroidia bacterium]
MEKLIQLFILIPLIGFIITLVIHRNDEKLISFVSFTSVGVSLTLFLCFTLFWFFYGAPVLNHKEIVIFYTTNYEFLLDFYFDKITAVYLFVGTFLTFLVTIYSRYYLHREIGYKRFFNTVMFFYLGYCITVVSGNFETLFIGWEILGISSFLLISFYRDRYLPVKNAIKVFSIYRIGDVGILLAMWMSHHLWNENITFLKLNNYDLVHAHLQNHSWVGVFISIMILISAAAKSAQFPFSSWLPRAMEGPTPSSAIFYGSLSVHMGVFLLLRTFPFWEHQYSVRVIIALLGIVTALIGTLTARVQSSVKSQIAYASIAQIGLIFVEISLGFEPLALIHFAGNAFLRTYQLLVSPSVVSYLIREQFYNFIPRKNSAEDSLPKRIQFTIYMLSLKEWNLDWLMFQFVWMPIKNVGRKMNFLNFKAIVIIFIVILLGGLLALHFESHIPYKIHRFLPEFFGIIGMLFVIKSFTERKNVFLSWTLVLMNNVMISLSVSFNEHFAYSHTLLYLSGIAVAGLLGYFCLFKLKKQEQLIDLNQFYGHSYKHPRLAFLFLLACLGLSGFPISPTFIGEDLIFTHIQENQASLALIVSISFIIDGLSLMRIYSRLFLGPHIKRFHDVGFRSS